MGAIKNWPSYSLVYIYESVVRYVEHATRKDSSPISLINPEGGQFMFAKCCLCILRIYTAYNYYKFLYVLRVVHGKHGK